MVCIYALWPREPSGGGLPQSASKSIIRQSTFVEKGTAKIEPYREIYYKQYIVIELRYTS